MIAVAFAGCVAAPPAPPDARAIAAGIYRAYLPAADATGRAITLELRGGGEARLTTLLVGSDEVIAETGRWSADASGVRAQFANATLTWTQQRMRLDPVRWDDRAYGATGLPLVRWLPSRAPRAGCTWQAVTDARLGLRLLAEACTPPATPFEVAATIAIFEKHADARIADALDARFVQSLPPVERDRCAVRAARRVDVGDPTKLAFEIAPTRKRGGALDAAPCGPYGARGGQSYFEYHPAESRSRVLFVRRGAFDERSIELLW